MVGLAADLFVKLWCQFTTCSMYVWVPILSLEQNLEGVGTLPVIPGGSDWLRMPLPCDFCICLHCSSRWSCQLFTFDLGFSDFDVKNLHFTLLFFFPEYKKLVGKELSCSLVTSIHGAKGTYENRLHCRVKGLCSVPIQVEARECVFSFPCGDSLFISR